MGYQVGRGSKNNYGRSVLRADDCFASGAMAELWLHISVLYRNKVGGNREICLCALEKLG